MGSQDNMTLNFDGIQTVQVHKTDLELSKEVLSLFINLSGQSKLNALAIEDQNALIGAISEALDKKLLTNDQESQLHTLIFCKSCRAIFKLSLSCGCRLCEHHISEFSTSLSSATFLTNSKFYELLLQKECPKCHLKLLESDLRLLIKNYESIKFKAEAEQSTKWMYKSFICNNCKRHRGPSMHLVGSCMHMCCICFNIRWAKMQTRDCVQCGEIINTNQLVNKQTRCCQCNQEYYILGDRMIEACQNHLFCATCMYSCIQNRCTQNSCSACNKLIQSKDTREIYNFLYADCWNCNEVVYRSCTRVTDCCKTYLCSVCQSGRYACPVCNQNFN